MSQKLQLNHSRLLHFHGETIPYFGIVVINVVYTVLTLGLYYPWAKTKLRNYIWSEISLEGTRFVYNGTGKELFKGFIIVYSIFALVLGFPYLLMNTPAIGFIGLIVFYLFLIFVLPFAIYAGWRYRVSRTSWRGIFFSFHGKFSQFAKTFYLHGLLAFVSFGIYYPWFRVKIQDYLISHTTFGDIEFDFQGEGSELFGINIVGTFLSYLSLGIYIPFYLKNRFNFTINNTMITKNESRSYLRSSLTGGDAFGTYFLIGIVFIVAFVAWTSSTFLFGAIAFSNGLSFTRILGIGLFLILAGIFSGWARLSIIKMRIANILIPNEIDLNTLEQNAERYNAATGDDLLDALDIDIDF